LVPVAADAVDSLAQPEGTHYVRCLVSILGNNGESHDVEIAGGLGCKVNVKTQQVRKLCSCRPKYGDFYRLEETVRIVSSHVNPRGLSG